MAEVKQLYSAVGAYEAQVFNVDKAYSALQRQADMQRRMQQQMNDEVDRMMQATFAQRGNARTQDRDGIAKEYENLTKFYTSNAADIKRGYGPVFSEFMDKMGSLRSNIAYSAALNDKTNKLLPVFKTKEGETEHTPDQLDYWKKYNESIYDKDGNLNQNRKKYFITRNVGGVAQSYSIDHLDVDDIIPQKVFNKPTMNKAVSDFARPFKVTYPVIKGDKQTISTIEMKDPLQIAGQTTSFLSSRPEANRWYANAFNTATPEMIEAANKEMTAMVDLFKENGKVFEWDTDKDNKISNPLEYAIYDQLKMNLPRELGDKINFTPGQNRRANETLNLARQRFDFTKMRWDTVVKNMSAKSIDEVFANVILSDGEESIDNWRDNIEAANQFYGAKALDTQGSGLPPNRIQFWSATDLQNPNNASQFDMLTRREDPTGQMRQSVKAKDIKQGAITVTSYLPIYDDKGNQLDVVNGRVPGFTGGTIKDPQTGKQVALNIEAGPDGKAYNRFVTVIPIDKGQNPNSVRSKLSIAFSRANDALTGKTTLQSAQNMMQSGKSLKMDVGGQRVGGTNQKSSSSKGEKEKKSSTNTKKQ